MHGVAFNRHAAALFRECGDLLHAQKANPFRANAYFRAAQTLESADKDVRQIICREGIEGLEKLPGIGRGLAAAIDEIARTSRYGQLDRLRGEASPEQLFQSIPGIGATLAKVIHDELQIETLEQLEVAAHDGSLDAIPGFGKRRADAVRAGVSAILGRRGSRYRSDLTPPVDELLDVDSEYRGRASAGKLPKIAPRRFNPAGEAWLPVLHTQRNDNHYTALYSNTARAHELGKTDDWVVIYYYDGDHREGQCTVVTETQGPNKGERVVRGREAESRRQKRA